MSPYSDSKNPEASTSQLLPRTSTYTMRDDDDVPPPSYSLVSQSAVDSLVAAGWPRRKAQKALEQYHDVSTATVYLEHQRHWSWRARTFNGPDESCPFCQEIERQTIASEKREYESRRAKGRERSDWRKENVYPKLEAATEVVAGTFAVPFYLAHRAKEKREERKAPQDEWDSDDYL